MKDIKIRKTIDSFNFAIEGLLHSVRTQRNMKIHLVIALLTLIAAGILGVSKIEAILLLLVIAMVIVAEVINTAVETVVDMVSTQYHPLAAIAKNVAAGAVLVAAINAMVIGYMIFYDKLIDISYRVISEIRHLPVHTTVFSLIIVMLLVIVLKAKGSHGTFLRGGMPSGHSALAASVLTSIALVSASLLIAALAGILTLLVLHSRLEAKVHTLWEIFVGALLGFLVTVLVFQIFQL